MTGHVKTPAKEGGDQLLSQRASHTRDLLFEACMRVFSRLGFSSATVADITQDAHLSRAVFYLYFTSKHDALVQVAQRVRDEFVQLLNQSAGPLRAGGTTGGEIWGSKGRKKGAQKGEEKGVEKGVERAIDVGAHRFVTQERAQTIAANAPPAGARTPGSEPVAQFCASSAALLSAFAAHHRLLKVIENEALSDAHIAPLWAQIHQAPIEWLAHHIESLTQEGFASAPAAPQVTARAFIGMLDEFSHDAPPYPQQRADLAELLCAMHLRLLSIDVPAKSDSPQSCRTRGAARGMRESGP